MGGGGGGGLSPQLWAIFAIFKKLMHFYAYFGQNSYFKAIIHQLKVLKVSLKYYIG